MTNWTIYWITRLDSLSEILGALSAISFPLTLIAAIVACTMHDDPDGDLPKRALKVLAPVTLFLTVAFALTPTTKEMCAIIAIPAIANSEDAQEIGRDIVELAKDWLK
ncbi:MAG: hypothetical protein GY928_07490, partial [Colwellia sp.]|nr:hypothetical protein [Colwellia sp.]